MLGSQRSSVHALPSLHSRGGPLAHPALGSQYSCPLHWLPSSHAGHRTNVPVVVVPAARGEAPLHVASFNEASTPATCSMTLGVPSKLVVSILVRKVSVHDSPAASCSDRSGVK